MTEKGWDVAMKKGNLITELRKGGTKLLYELGRQNIELATAAFDPGRLRQEVFPLLKELYGVAQTVGAHPYFGPIIETEENLLVVPDERDASWLTLDGKDALLPLARTASVQFTIETRGPIHAIELLAALAEKRSSLLRVNPHPQEAFWRNYIATSKAGYRPDRYGIVIPESIERYVELLSSHDVAMNGKLTPFAEAEQPIDLFLRSVWWIFRLRRYSDRLCIEIRTLARRDDEQIFNDYCRIIPLIIEFP